MRVVQVTPFYPPDWGGIARHVWGLSRALSRNCNVLVVGCCGQRSEGLLSEGPPFSGVRCVSPPGLVLKTLRSLRIPVRPDRLVGAVRSFDPDVVHVHGHHFPTTWISALLLGDYPTVLTVHGTYALHPGGGASLLEEAFNRTVLRWLLGRVDAVIAISGHVADYVRRYGAGSVRVIPGGVDVTKFQEARRRRAEIRERLGLPQEAKIVLYAGRLVDVKGSLELALAAARLRREKDDIFFVIAGDGYLRGEVRRIVEGGGAGVVLPWVPADRVHELFAAADVFVNPARAEGLGLALVEAMAAGLAIAATPVGGAIDALRGYPLWARIDSVEPGSISAAIREALGLLDSGVTADPPWQFDWSRIAGMVLSVYLEVVGSSQGAPILGARGL